MRGEVFGRIWEGIFALEFFFSGFCGDWIEFYLV